MGSFLVPETTTEGSHPGHDRLLILVVYLNVANKMENTHVQPVAVAFKLIRREIVELWLLLLGGPKFDENKFNRHTF